jgi:hypothetical protein
VHPVDSSNRKSRTHDLVSKPSLGPTGHLPSIAKTDFAHQPSWRRTTRIRRKISHLRKVRRSCPRFRILADASVDVFGFKIANKQALTPELARLQSEIHDLRSRLQALGILRMTHSNDSMAALPASSLWMHLSEQMEEIISLASALPRSVDHSSVQVALDSFFSEIDASQDALRQLGQLCTLSVVINENDGLLSDLLEHIDRRNN